MTPRTGAAVRGAWPTVAALLAVVLAVAGCGADDDTGAPGRTLVIGAIPDQDTDRLQEIYGSTARYLAQQLGSPVEFRPVTDYPAAVSQFRTGRLDLVFFGGLTGVQARLQTPGAVPLVQRDIDDDFRSVFIAGAGARIAPFTSAAGLAGLRGHTFTYGSQSSTSGYLMPAYHLQRAGVDPQRGFAGRPGFSGSHDKTVDLVASGSFAAGVLNQQVWQRRLQAGTVDRDRVVELWRTPAYADYHWVLGPSAARDLGPDLGQRITAAFLRLSTDNPADAALLKLFGATSFIPAEPAGYRQIEEIGRQLGLVRTP